MKYSRYSLPASIFLLGSMIAKADDHAPAAHDSPTKHASPAAHDSSSSAHDHDANHEHSFESLGGFDFSNGWLDAPSLRHQTADGNQIVFPFGMAPGFLSDDLFLDYFYLSLEDEDEHEFELELEWALTRRIGFAIGVPYILVRPDGAGGGHGHDTGGHDTGDEHHAAGAQAKSATHEMEGHHEDEEGWGDLFFGPRFVFSDTDHSSTTFNFEVQVPTGSKSVGAGDEVHLAPSISDWRDFGGGFSLHTQAGVEVGLESDESELFYRIGVSKAMGDFALTAQLAGHTILDEGKEGHGDEGDTTLTGLIGMSYRIGGDLDLRAAYLFPVNSRSELDNGMRFGIIKHF